MENDKIKMCVLLSLIVLMVLYMNGYFDTEEGFEVPQLTQNNNKIFTYLEKNYKGTDRVSLPFNNRVRDIPVFFKYSANLMSKYSVVVVTPENINHYLTQSEIPFRNSPDSMLSFKNRSDLIGAALLYKYGGMFVERGTIMMKDPTPLLEKLTMYDTITIGMSRHAPGPSCCSIENAPNNQILISRPDNPLLKKYMSNLFSVCSSGVVKGGNFDNPGIKALSDALVKENETNPSFKHINFGADFDGTRDHHNNYVDYNLLLGNEDVIYKSIDTLYFISSPTDELYRIPQYSWFLTSNEEDFAETNVFLTRILKTKLKDI